MEAPPRKRPLSATRVAVFATLLALLWGHFEAIGHGDPRTPSVLTMTSTWSIAGTWPWLRSDADGTTILWSGLAMGIVLTAAAAWICLRRTAN